MRNGGDMGSVDTADRPHGASKGADATVPRSIDTVNVDSTARLPVDTMNAEPRGNMARPQGSVAPINGEAERNSESTATSLLPTMTGAVGKKDSLAAVADTERLKRWTSMGMAPSRKKSSTVFAIGVGNTLPDATQSAELNLRTRLTARERRVQRL